MKMKYLYISLILLLSTIVQAGTIKRQVLSNQGGTPIPFASISLSESGISTIIAGSISNENGMFKIDKIPHGKYTVSVSFIGFETKEISNILINSKENRIELGHIILSPSAVNLKGVEINATQKTVINSIDRQTYTSSDFATANGGTAIDILGKLPAVSIDGNLQSRHNNGIGIIDPYIFQKLGTVNNTYGGKYYVLDGEGSRPKWYTNKMASINASYKINKHSDIAISYQYSQRESGRTANYKYDAFFAETPTEQAIPNTLQKIYNPNDIQRNGWFSNTRLDYHLNINEHSHLTTTLIYESSNLEQTIENKEYSYDDERYYLDDIPSFHSFQSDKTPLKAYRLALSYELKLKNNDLLSTGIQSQWLNLEGAFRYDTLIGNAYYGNADSYNNDINLKRDIYAADVDYSGKKDQLSYVLGLRMEYINQRMDVASTDYFEYIYDYFKEVGNIRNFNQKQFNQNQLDFFPSLHIAYQANENNNFKLAASRRINRPPAKDLSPFLYRRHQEIYEMGDPLLKPEYIVNTQLSYTHTFGKNNVTFSGFYRGINDAIYCVNRVAYDMGNLGGVLLRSYTNAGDQRTLGAELGLNMDLQNQVKLFIGGSLYDFKVDADNELLGDSRKNSSTNWDLKSNLI